MPEPGKTAVRGQTGTDVNGNIAAIHRCCYRVFKEHTFAKAFSESPTKGE